MKSRFLNLVILMVLTNSITFTVGCGKMQSKPGSSQSTNVTNQTVNLPKTDFHTQTQDDPLKDQFEDPKTLIPNKEQLKKQETAFFEQYPYLKNAQEVEKGQDLEEEETQTASDQTMPIIMHDEPASETMEMQMPDQLTPTTVIVKSPTSNKAPTKTPSKPNTASSAPSKPTFNNSKSPITTNQVAPNQVTPKKEIPAPPTKTEAKIEIAGPTEKFTLPMTTTEVSYFFGPRIFQSYNLFTRIKESLLNGVAFVFKGVKKSSKHSHHGGIDFPIMTDESGKKLDLVRSPGDGTVKVKAYDYCSGNMLVVEHKFQNQSVYTVYRHLETYSKDLKVNAVVKQNQILAKAGATGRKMRVVNINGRLTKEGCVSGPHLHFEMRVPKNDKTDLKNLTDMYLQTSEVNPSDYLSEVNELCVERRTIELKNALLALEQAKGSAYPISAGLCSQYYETHYVQKYFHGVE